MDATPAIRDFKVANDAYQSIVVQLEGDKAGQQAAEDYLRQSTAVYKGDIIRFGFYPKLYPASTFNYMANIAQQIYSLCEHAVQLFRDDAAFRRQFQFDELTEQLCLTNAHYATTIPIMRADLFLNESNFSFTLCEFNTDGTSAMNEDREMACALAQTQSYLQAQTNGVRPQSCNGVRPQELFDSWVHTFERIYADFAAQTSSTATPTIAIVDFLDNTSHTELDYFQQRFEALGHKCVLADIRDLVWQNAELSARETKIDAVYRRATTGVVLASLQNSTSLRGSTKTELAKSDGLSSENLVLPRRSILNLKTMHDATGSAALIAASQSNRVALIGSWQTQIVHVKQFFAVLHEVLGQNKLSVLEEDFVRQHIPYTTYLTSDFVQDSTISSEKDSWIIKPLDDYGSDGVYAGKDFSPSEWAALIKQHAATDSAATYIAQAYAPQYATPNIMLGGGGVGGRTLPAPKPAQIELYNNLTGLFIYGGQLAGVFGRANSVDKGLIVGFEGGMSVPSLLC